MTSFDEFILQLADCSGSGFGPRVEWAKYPSENPYFVPPNLEHEPSGPPKSPIILVSAPGAIGKTTFAEAVAYRRHAPVFDLAKRRVGTDAFIGLLGNAFGFENISEIYPRLKTGTFLLVLDALDETRVGSGQTNFEGFLEDLAGHFKGHESAPSVVLLARVDTAELIALALELHDVQYLHYRITLFDEAAAPVFLDRYLDARCDEARVSRAHRTHREAFQKVRDEIFGLIKTSVPAGHPMELLGYAPVLVTLGEWLYGEPNYHALETALEEWRYEGAWSLLAKLAEDLLVREQKKKFLVQLPVEIRSHVPDALSVDEQCFWLLLEYVDMRTQLSTPSTVPQRLLSAYEQAVETQMQEHVFRKERKGKGAFHHQAFLEYVLAWFLARFPRDRKDIQDHIRGKLLERNDLLPSPLLGRFALGLTNGGADKTSPATIRAEDIGFLYESFSAQSDENLKAWLTLDSVEGTNEMRGAIGVGEAHAAKLRVIDTDRGLWLWRHLANAQLRVSCRVELGVQRGEFILGPDVDVECSQFSCPVRHMEVVANNKDDSVVIEAVTCQEPSQPSLRTHGNFFFVRWPRLSYPWIRHELKATELVNTTAQLLQAYTYLARILKRLRARGYGEVARHRDIIENFATGGTATGKAMLRYCLKEGVVVSKGELFVLNDGQAAKLGINWADLRLRTLSSGVRDFLSRFLRENAASRVSV